MNYNINVDVITQALRDGASQEEIANIFANALNQASATIKKENAERKAKEAEAKKVQEQKLAHAQAVADFYNIYYPDLMGSESISGEDILKACEEAKNLFSKIQNLAHEIESAPKTSAENPLFRIFGL